MEGGPGMVSIRGHPHLRFGCRPTHAPHLLLHLHVVLVTIMALLGGFLRGGGRSIVAHHLTSARVVGSLPRAHLPVVRV